MNLRVSLLVPILVTASAVGSQRASQTTRGDAGARLEVGMTQVHQILPNQPPPTSITARVLARPANTRTIVSMEGMPHGQEAVTEFLSGQNVTRLEKLARRMNVSIESAEKSFSDNSLFLDLNTLDNVEGPEIFYMGAHRRNFSEQDVISPSDSKRHRRYLYGAESADAMRLHSNPNATRILYLDFDGHDLTGTAWSRTSTLVAPPCDWDGNPASFSDAEKGKIKKIWSFVAEDFAPFDVDVTTEVQSEDQITRSSLSDSHYGNRVLIAPGIAHVCGNSCGGVSYVGIFARTGKLITRSSYCIQVSTDVLSSLQSWNGICFKVCSVSLSDECTACCHR